MEQLTYKTGKLFSQPLLITEISQSQVGYFRPLLGQLDVQ